MIQLAAGRLTWPTYLRYWAVGLGATGLVMAICLMIGVDPLHPERTAFAWPAQSVLELRLTRVGSAALVGAALAASGVLLQALLRNPLAEPYVLGISTGSSVAVLVWVLFGMSVFGAVEHGHIPAWLESVFAYGEVLPAVIGALLASVAVFTIAGVTSGATLEPLTLLLVGVVISAFNGALIVLLNSIAPHGNRPDIINFLIGYIDSISPTTLLVAGGVFVASWVAGLLAAPSLNIAALSDTEATSLGLRLARMRTLCFVLASIMTASAIALARSIAFVGLICPHICRVLFGSDHRQLLVTAPFCGAIFLMLADALVQILRGIFPVTVPVGVITALAGGPFFLILLMQRRTTLHD